MHVDASSLPPYDEALLARELALFPDWLVMHEFEVTWTEAQRQQWGRVCRVLIDSALLADDLPINAYLDKGFQAWLSELSSQD